MDREGIKELLRDVLGHHIELIDHDKWVSLCCPLAPWTHSRGTDKTPSAGISINEDGNSVYHCWGCLGQNKGPLSWFLREYEKYTGEDVGRYVREIEQNEFLGGTLPEWGSKTTKKKELKVLDESQYLDLFDSAVGHPYLISREITKRTTRLAGLRLDPEDAHGAERIIFPVYTPKKELVGFTSRATSSDVEPKVRDYYGLRKEMVLLGSHLVGEAPYVVVVEGLFDYLKGIQCGEPAVAAMHAGLTQHQESILLDMGKPVILMFDKDEPGAEAAERVAEKLRGKLPLSKARYPVRYDKRGKKCKGKLDPGMLTEDEIKNAIAKSVLL